MPTFLCEKCGAIENTALCNYWYRKCENLPVCCSKCETGIWHNHFERKHWSSYGLDAILQAQKQDQGDMINAREHLRNIGVIGSKKITHKEVDWED